jgi:hypothetical protein
MFDFLCDLPLVITGPAIIGSLCLFAIGGLLLVRRRVLPRLRIHVEDSEFIGAMMQCVLGTFWDLLDLGPSGVTSRLSMARNCVRRLQGWGDVGTSRQGLVIV